MSQKKYYNGPEGVYWDDMHEEIFILEFSGSSMMKLKGRKMKHLGPCYFMESKKWGKVKGRNGLGVGVYLHKKCFYLGPL